MHAILTGNDMFEHLLLPRESLSPSLVSFLIARASFIQIYSHFAKKKKRRRTKTTKSDAKFAIFLEWQENSKFIYTESREEGVHSAIISKKKKKKIIPKIKSPSPFCSLVETLHTRSTLHPLSPNYPYTLILNLDDTRMNEACLCVCVGERKIEWTVARGTKPR